MSEIENENDFSLDFLLNLKNDLLDTIQYVNKEIKRIKKNTEPDRTETETDTDSSDDTYTAKTDSSDHYLYIYCKKCGKESETFCLNGYCEECRYEKNKKCDNSDCS